VRPLLKVLVDIHDALALAAREVRRVQEAVLPVLEELEAAAAAAAAPPEPGPAVAAPVAPSFWARFLGLDRTILQQQETIAALVKALAEERSRQGPQPAPPLPDLAEAAGRARQMLASMTAGYTMSLQRLEKALGDQGLEPIPVAGEPYDPERMEVLEAVLDSDRPSGEVLEEVRRGYF
jgi:hypothetical protein